MSIYKANMESRNLFFCFILLPWHLHVALHTLFVCHWVSNSRRTSIRFTWLTAGFSSRTHRANLQWLIDGGALASYRLVSLFLSYDHWSPGAPKPTLDTKSHLNWGKPLHLLKVALVSDPNLLLASSDIDGSVGFLSGVSFAIWC